MIPWTNPLKTNGLPNHIKNVQESTIQFVYLHSIIFDSLFCAVCILYILQKKPIGLFVFQQFKSVCVYE